MYRIIFVLLILAVLYLPGYFDNAVLDLFTEEDGPYEWAGALFFLFTSVGFLVLTLKPAYYKFNSGDGGYGERKYFALLALLFFFAFGEEISWGQRIFNFETPESLEEFNRQGEFNIHNLAVFHGRTETGERKTGLQSLITMHRLYYFFFFAYLVVLPIGSRIPRVKRLVDKYNVPVPPLIIGALFILNLAFGNSVREINTRVDGHGIVEIKEMVMALILLLLPLSFLRLDRLVGAGRGHSKKINR